MNREAIKYIEDILEYELEWMNDQTMGYEQVVTGIYDVDRDEESFKDEMAREMIELRNNTTIELQNRCNVFKYILQMLKEKEISSQ